MIASSLAKNLMPTAEGAAVGKTSVRGLARCFPDRYADGLWVASNATLSYHMTLETWQYGMCDRSSLNHRSALKAQSVGVADVLLPTRSDPYEWKPRDDSCALPRLDTATVCTLLRGRRIMFVGDSVIMSVFYSIALALQARTSMDSKGINRRAIVDCGNNATVLFSAVRNDHLQLPGVPRPAWVPRYTIAGNWLRHAPDFTVMASGLHDVTRGGSYLSGTDTFGERLAAAITRSGDPARTAAVTIAAPQPGCINISKPLHLSRARRRANSSRWRQDDATLAGRNFLAQWRVWESRREIARTVARQTGATFLDLTAITTTRPDRALGRTKSYLWEKQRTQQGAARRPIVIHPADRDCVHYCLPGPTDTAARIVLGWAALRNIQEAG